MEVLLLKCELTARYERTLSVLTQLAYTAAIDSQKWQLFVDHASELCGGIGVHLFGHDDMTSAALGVVCLLYTSPSPRDKRQSRMPSSA